VLETKPTLGNLCEFIVDSEHKTAPTQNDGFPVIRTPNIGRGYFLLENVRRVSAETYEKWTRRAIPRENDLILAREAPVGNVARISSNMNVCLGQRTVLIRPDTQKIDPTYLTYLLLGDEVQGTIQSLSNGATVSHLNIKDIRVLSLPALPPLPTQRKIASVLSAYDDLIENNTRRIQILEETAQAIYREWFVNFRFPGHEKVGMVDSPLGKIPEGWEVKRLSEVASVHRGRSYKSKEIVQDGGLPFLNLKCINRDGGFRYDGIKRYLGLYKESQTANPGDIVMAVTDMTQERRIVARAARVPANGQGTSVFSMDLVKVAPNSNIASEYLYGMLRFSTFADQVKQYANGANVLHLSPARIEAFPFALPPKELRIRFAEIFSDTHQQMDFLHLKNDNLRRARDLLLPKLISGEIGLDDKS
jgi:type I restriction enzyme S subunit